MTNKEVIEKLKIAGEYAETIDNAIKSLERQKCINCKHHMFSDMYLECGKAVSGTYPNYNDGCNLWEIVG